MIEFSTTLEQFSNNVYGYHLPVDANITTLMTSDTHKRVKCTLNNSIQIHSGLMPIDGGSFILINKKVRNKLGLELGDSVSVAIEKDTSEYGIPMPDSFMVLLDQDKEGSIFFHALTPGKQRSLIYLTSKVKNIDKQINKGLAILEHLRDVQGKLDYKMLAEKIKAYNQRDNFT